MWIYAQATGQLLNPDGTLGGTGYAGRGESKNNPDDQCKADQGPLPRNTYTIGPAMDHPRLGPLALPLVPDDPAKMCNPARNAFYIHGDSSSHPGEASDGCIIMARNIRQSVSASRDRKLMVVGSLDDALATAMVTILGKAPPPPPSVRLMLRQLVLPLALMVAAVMVHWLASGSPGVALFFGWILCAMAATRVVMAVQDPLANEVGRYDAAHLFTIAWFVLLTSAMASGSLWNVFVWRTDTTTLNAFINVPASVWILGGITLLSNVGIRLTFALSQKPNQLEKEPLQSKLDEIVTPPLDSDGSTKMASAQYVLFNLLALVVYGVAIARMFALATAGEPLGSFPAIPDEVLGLFAVSAGGFVVTSAVPGLRR
ncbi:MAG: DUF2778 domain-containing protein [Betaproteobacteria bacterium]|nr:DUF2778 domain-containing protein [Betaproteobacteria bacterium]